MTDNELPTDLTALEEAAAAQADAQYILRLYITGTTPNSTRAMVNIRKICEEHLRGRYELEIVDISQHPTLAEGEQIIAAPTLIKKLPLPLRRFAPAGETRRFANGEQPLKIIFPLNGAQLALERNDPQAAPLPIAIKTNGGNGPYRFLVDGAPIGDAEFRNATFWQPGGPGFVRLTVIDASGATDSVLVRLQP